MSESGDLLQLLKRRAHPRRIHGPIIEAPLPLVSIGELCLIRAAADSDEIIGRAQVVGFGRDVAILSTLGSTTGLSRQAVLVPTGERLAIEMSPWMLGTVVDSTGQCTEVLRADTADVPFAAPRRMDVDAPPPDYSERRPITECLATGIRVIDGLLTCGVGQRFGIFAAAGCGKTSLMNMLIEHSAAEVYVVALVGERGREVSEFVERLKHSSRRDNTIVVYATSDRSSVDRCNAALLATTIAEYFRDMGKDVMLFLDSMTRYARALRDVALAAGESPARRGYPASVFESMPRLLERPGQTADGSITAFYTVLLENEEEPDPIGDEIRSIIDGHIYLSKKLAGKGHFPAIDVLKSASRLFDEITDAPHRQQAKRFRQHLARLDEMQIFLDLGEYRQGENPDNDAALERRPALEAYLQQSLADASDLRKTLERLHETVQ
jgi:FliI/YscN family ATPase